MARAQLLLTHAAPGVVHYRTESVVRLVDPQSQVQASVRAQESASRAALRAVDRRLQDLQRRVKEV